MMSYLRAGSHSDRHHAEEGDQAQEGQAAERKCNGQQQECFIDGPSYRRPYRVLLQSTSWTTGGALLHDADALPQGDL
jgi:hypothetical protein